MKSPAQMIQRDAAMIAMIQRGISLDEIAKRMDRQKRTVSNWFADGFAKRSARWRIEAALEYRVPIWSTSSELRTRERCAGELGFDPFLIGRTELRTRAGRLGVSVEGYESLEKIRAAIMERLETRWQEARNSGTATGGT
ncbi:MAG: hypothetical protein JNK85_05485 [Verrucomicrobiales bacterium]|nr:hypothetical protein [Verrucomicrobiales bacterium]